MLHSCTYIKIYVYKYDQEYIGALVDLYTCNEYCDYAHCISVMNTCTINVHVLALTNLRVTTCIYTHKQMLKSDGVKVQFALSLPADFPIGSYRVELEVTPENSWNGSKFDVEKEVVVLFNPWCKGK